jgi:hypothetical protein
VQGWGGKVGARAGPRPARRVPITSLVVAPSRAYSPPPTSFSSLLLYLSWPHQQSTSVSLLLPDITNIHMLCFVHRLSDTQPSSQACFTVLRTDALSKRKQTRTNSSMPSTRVSTSSSRHGRHGNRSRARRRRLEMVVCVHVYFGDSRGEGLTGRKVITDPEDPKFDLEKLVSKWEKELA